MAFAQAATRTKLHGAGELSQSPYTEPILSLLAFGKAKERIDRGRPFWQKGGVFFLCKSVTTGMGQPQTHAFGHALQP